jgi:hypothetical protein
MLKMKATINLLPLRKLHTLDVYSGVEATVVVQEVVTCASENGPQNFNFLISCPQVRQTYGGGDIKDSIAGRTPIFWSNHVNDRAIPTHYIVHLHPVAHGQIGPKHVV